MSLSRNFGCLMEVCRRCCCVELSGGQFRAPFAERSIPLLSFPQPAPLTVLQFSPLSFSFLLSFSSMSVSYLENTLISVLSS